MIAVFLSPLYLLANLYVLQWILRWLGACHEVFGRHDVKIAVVVVYAFFALALLAGFLLPIGFAKRVMQLIGNYWLGVFLYLILTVAIADVLRLVLKNGVDSAARHRVPAGFSCASEEPARCSWPQ